MRALKIVFVVVLLASALAGAQVAIRPGQYEVLLDMDLIPKEGQKAVLDAAGFQKNKRLECITAADVTDIKDIPKLFAREMEDENCKLSDVKNAGNKLTFTMTCVDEGKRLTTNTEMTFAGDSFAAVSKGKDFEGRPISMKYSAKRLGDCPK